VHLVVYLLV